jgi:hypothetical protein
MMRRLWSPWLKRPHAPFTPGRPAPAHSRRRDYRPQLEILENRTLPSFVTASNFPTGASPNAIAVGDLNGDGKLDLVTVGFGTFSNPNVLSVLLNSGSGTFAAPVNYTTDASPVAVAVGDFTGDGKLDVVTVNQGGNDVSVFRGNGDGTFQSAINYSTGKSPEAVAVGDFNGDGKLDLAVANGGAGNLSILLGNGNGTFAAATNVSLVSGSPSSVAVGDFNGDGKLDLATANGGLAGINVLLGNGNGTFQAAVHYATDANAGAVAVKDFNGDGKPDLAVACAATGFDDILLGNGDGTFQAFRKYAEGGNPDALIMADVNGDGHPDLITVNGGLPIGTGANNSVSVLLNNGKGTFAAPLLFVTDQNPVAVAAGKFLGDGKLDLVVVNHDSNDVSLLAGDGNGIFEAPRDVSSVGLGNGAIVAADFNGDGVTDLALAHPSGAALRTINILLNNGDGTFRNSITLTTGASACDMVAGDFNGDGKMDLAVSTTDGSCNPVIAVFLSNGNGTFKKAIDSPSTNALCDLAVGEFNGDTSLDLVGIDNSDNLVDVLLGNGDGTFQAAINFATGKHPTAVAVADFNGDGKADLAVTNNGDSTVGVLFGNGNGMFGTQAAYAVGGGDTDVTAADLNGDGKPDLVVAYNSPLKPNVDVLLNNGDGTFAKAVAYVAGGDFINTVTVAVADLTGDGIPDIVTVNDDRNDVSVLAGNGDGTFGAAINYAVGGSPDAGTIGDFNRDGQLNDVAVTNGTVTVLLSQTTTHFSTNAPTLTTAGKSFSITVTAENSDGSTATGFTGTIHFTSSDPKATLPSNYTFVAGDQGFHTFTGVILDKAGTRYLVVNDTLNPSFGGSAAIKVKQAALAQFGITAPKTATSGTAFTITVIAEDAFGNVITGYDGTVAFTSSDGSASLPGDYTFLPSVDHGKHTFTVTLNTTGNQTITVMDTVHSTIKGTATVKVNAPGRDGAALGGDGPDPSGGDDFAG